MYAHEVTLCSWRGRCFAQKWVKGHIAHLKGSSVQLSSFYVAIGHWGGCVVGIRRGQRVG